MSTLRYRVILAIICAVAIVRVASTFHIFCATTDEPSHLSGGYAWLTGAPYPRDLLHPPLGQVLSALPIALKHPPKPVEGIDVVVGNQLLYSDREYMRNVELMRIGNLLFLIVGACAVAAWGRRTFDDKTGLIAAALWSLQPTLLAHCGLATTDPSLIGLFPVAMLALDRWIDQPTLRRSIEMGLVCGIATLGKFSFIPFFIVAAIVIFAIRWRAIVWRKNLTGIGIAFVALMLVLWAGYRFSFGTIIASHPNAPTVVAKKMSHFRWFAEHVPIPAPQFFTGLGALSIHNSHGQLSYLMGRYSMFGFREYFPVLLFYKTPVAFTLLFVWGVVCIARARRGFIPLAVGIAILLSVMPSHINVGVRHVAPLYAAFVIVAAFGVTTAWDESRGVLFGRTALAGICAWLVIANAAAHPDYLAYFNELAGERPAWIAVDSNLDWGQDWMRFLRWQQRTQPGKVGLVWTGSIDLSKHSVDVFGIPPYTKTPGWVAVSETAMKLANTNGKDYGDPYRWIETYTPVERIGKSIRIYHIEE